MKFYRRVLGRLISFVIVFSGIYACANKGYPEGGPKDETPPKVVAEQPASFATNFNKKSISIYFDEFVQLKNVGEKFITSPPMAKNPKVRLRGKYILVEFQDTLRTETTYNMDFTDVIVDNNEGNPMGYYRYVFSTGSVIDSLELSGTLVEAETNTPLLGAFVFLYANHADSVPLTEIPNYIALTDSMGFFRLTNLKEADYKLIAVKDDSRDYKFTPEQEWIAFMDTLVHPVVSRVTRTDTIGKDSIVENEYLMYGPNNLYLRMFEEESTQLYMLTEERKERAKLSFIFSVPGENEFKIRILDSLLQASKDWYMVERSAGNDTIHLWIKDSLVYKKDTLNFELTYLRSDSTKQWTSFTDTTRLTYVDKKKPENPRRKRDTVTTPAYDFLKINVGSGDQDLHRGIHIEFDQPIQESGLDSIRLMEKVDSLYQPVKFVLHKDSLKIRNYYLEAKWVPEKEYVLAIDSGAMQNIYGFHNDKTERKFKVKTEESYGKIILNLKEVRGQVILQLYKPDTRKTESGRKIFTVAEEKIVNKDGEVVFDFLQPTKYELRAILDANGNGKYDTGLYLKNIQPEVVVYYPGEITIRQNFDFEMDFDLEKMYKKIDDRFMPNRKTKESD